MSWILVKKFNDLASFYNNLENKIPDIILIDINYSYLISSDAIYNHIKNTPVYQDILIIFIVANNEITDLTIKLASNYSDYDSLKKMVNISRIEFLNYISFRSKIKRVHYTNLNSNQKHIINELNQLLITKQIYNLQISSFCESLNTSESEINKITKMVFNKPLSAFFKDFSATDTNIDFLKLNSLKENVGVMNNKPPNYFYINEEEI